MNPPFCPYCHKKPDVLGTEVGLGYVVSCKKQWDHNVSVFGATPEEAIQKWYTAFSEKPFSLLQFFRRSK